MTNWGLIGGTYVSRSIVADCEECINLYPEYMESGQAKNKFVLYKTPGRLSFVTLPLSPIRGIFAIPAGALDGSTLTDRLFVAAGGTAGATAWLYEVFDDASYNAVGAIGTGTGPVQMFVNGTQLFIVASDQGYLADGAGIAPVIPARTGGFLNGYFLAAQPPTPPSLDGTHLNFSALRDGTSWNALDFSVNEAQPDNINSILTNHEEVWVFGFYHTEVFQQVATEDTFIKIPGAMIEEGCGAAYSPAKGEQGEIYWLSGDTRGGCQVLMARGWIPQRVSTHAIEYAIQQFTAADIAAAVGYCYQDQGHSFYVLTFPLITLVYDATAKLWHKRGYWNAPRGRYDADLAKYHAFAFGRHFVASGVDGKLYTQSIAYKNDDGARIRCLRRSPHVNRENLRLRHYRLQIDMQVGEGIGAGGANPATAMLRFSNDGGNTWSEEVSATMGAVGQYLTRVQWWSLGMAIDRVYELVVSDDVTVAIVNGYLDVDEGGM